MNHSVAPMLEAWTLTAHVGLLGQTSQPGTQRPRRGGERLPPRS